MSETQVPATSAAKQLADEKGVDLSMVKPTGANGDVTKADVEAVIAEDSEVSQDEASESEAVEPEKVVDFHVNPDVGASYAGVILRLPDGSDKTYLQGETYSASEGLYDFLAKNKTRGVQSVKKGRI